MSQKIIARIDSARNCLTANPGVYARTMAAIARSTTTAAQLGLVFAAIIEDGTLEMFTTRVDAFGQSTLVAKAG